MDFIKIKNSGASKATNMGFPGGPVVKTACFHEAQV